MENKIKNGDISLNNSEKAILLMIESGQVSNMDTAEKLANFAMSCFKSSRIVDWNVFEFVDDAKEKVKSTIINRLQGGNPVYMSKLKEYLKRQNYYKQANQKYISTGGHGDIFSYLIQQLIDERLVVIDGRKMSLRCE